MNAVWGLFTVGVLCLSLLDGEYTLHEEVFTKGPGTLFSSSFFLEGTYSSVQAYLEGTHLSLFWGASELIQLNADLQT